MHNEIDAHEMEMPKPLVATQRYERDGDWRKLIMSRLTPEIVVYASPVGECGISQRTALRVQRLLMRNWSRK